jgi:hypothetical protein
LVDRISAVYAHGQLQAHRAVNEQLTRTFWQIGHDIVECEQGGQTRAAYGQSLITNLSRDLHLRCFVLIDLKMHEVEHHDIGQMNLYLGYFAAEENGEGDNPPIGIILTRHL